LGTGLVRLIVPSLRARVTPGAFPLQGLLVVFLGRTWLSPIGAARRRRTGSARRDRRSRGLRLFEQPASAPDPDPRSAATHRQHRRQPVRQVESRYEVDVCAPASATITPFGRQQISSVTQNAFSESGAQSLSLNVAQQTTSSLRTTISADLSSDIDLGSEKKLDFAVRLGWQHEFADAGRPITAAFAGAPGNSFTVFGATPTRDSAIVGFQATTTIAEATQVYLRYDGAVGGGTDNHVGVRMSW
jgi:hypothetical protein